MKDEEILQYLYDKGMIDFEGDEDGLTMQIPPNVIIKTGQFVVDIFKEGQKAERKRILELIDKLDDYGMEVVRTFKRELKNKIKQKEK